MEFEMKRKIIEIDEEKCDGCGLCIPACPEGALQLIDGKAKLVKDFYCDGLGACLGHCPQGAITVIERDAEDYDERAVMQNVIKQGKEVIQQHLAHLRESNEFDNLQIAEEVLAQHQEHGSGLAMAVEQPSSGCPGSQSVSFAAQSAPSGQTAEIPAALSHWPIQMHLISPLAPHYRQTDILLAADCVPFALPDFHQSYLAGRTLAIACPKLDHNQDIYLEKLKALIDQAEIESLSVIVMQVPCCAGLVQLAQTAAQQAQRYIPMKATVIGIDGTVLKEIDIN
jgi:ferredoxin